MPCVVYKNYIHCSEQHNKVIQHIVALMGEWCDLLIHCHALCIKSAWQNSLLWPVCINALQKHSLHWCTECALLLRRSANTLSCPVPGSLPEYRSPLLHTINTRHTMQNLYKLSYRINTGIPLNWSNWRYDIMKFHILTKIYLGNYFIFILMIGTVMMLMNEDSNIFHQAN